ncbi:hypothetical protein [Shewanella baltica]|uniref:hypothetical protein n=1 Tax=Shewanella baltica TaxID=62322 RepID=UPI00217D9E34|nr:hypothetical protein [Shewanella baltica]MCS6192990.1 hypothetical protein [Shewanella baltica]MCS6241733.1 hypothetical protein [Shewanella baltica]
MDCSSFFGGVVATLIGVFSTVLVTKKVETLKHELESKKALKRLYIELADLCEECKDNLSELKDTYYRTWHIEKGYQVDAMWAGVSIPKPPNTMILESHIDKSFEDLTKEQRIGIRAILHLCRQIDDSITSLTRQMGDGKISSVSVKNYMSILCALYHLSLNMKEQEGRFVKINKRPEDVQESVFKSLGIDLSCDACAGYQVVVS